MDDGSSSSYYSLLAHQQVVVLALCDGPNDQDQGILTQAVWQEQAMGSLWGKENVGERQRLKILACPAKTNLSAVLKSRVCHVVATFRVSFFAVKFPLGFRFRCCLAAITGPIVDLQQ